MLYLLHTFINVRNFMNWYLHGVYGTETDPTLISVGEETWFLVSPYVNYKQNASSRSAQSPALLTECCSHDVELGRGML